MKCQFLSMCLYGLFLLNSCCDKKINATESLPVPISEETSTNSKLIAATVIDYSSVDGCGFLLELSTGEKLQPENLDQHFAKDQLRVLVKFHAVNKMGICMAGKIVHIDSIKMKN